jgi:hypothetical protein
MHNTGRSAKAVALTVFLAAAAIIAAACDSLTEPTTPIGSYTLSTVNGEDIPATMYAEGMYKLEVVGGTMELDTDSNYIATVTSEETVDAIVSEYVDSLRGRWSVDESGTMQFTFPEDNSIFTGSWQGRRITLLVTGDVSVSLVYEKPR